MGILQFIERLLAHCWVGAALGVAVVVAPLPEVEGGWLEGPRLAFGVIVLVCSLGKGLYDTLFYDRYQP